MRRPRVLGLLACLALAPVLPAVAAGPPHIALILRSDGSPFWKSVEQGAQQAAHDLGVTVGFSAPADEPAADTQAALLDQALSAAPAAVCIDALDSTKIAPLLVKARRGRVPVIGLGQGVDSPLVLTTVAPDNAAAAALAANKLGSLLSGVGTVGLVLPDASSRTSVARRDGFRKLLERRYPGIRLLDPSYSGGDPKAAADQVKQLMQATPALSGIFIADEDAAPGVISALQDSRAGGRVVVVGFDSGAAQVEAVRSGLLAGAVTRDPVRLGYRAVAAAVDAVNGRHLPPFIDTGFHWYDRSNVNDPSIAAILHP